MKNKLLEKKKRFDVVSGVIIASALGLLLNLLASLYYDLFITKTVLWDKVDHTQVFGLIFLLIGALGFLSFFIDDYKNDLKLNIGFLERFYNYFFYNFTLGKIIRFATGIYLLFVLLIVLLFLFIVLTKIASIWVSIPTFIFIIVIFILGERARKKKQLG